MHGLKIGGKLAGMVVCALITGAAVYLVGLTGLPAWLSPTLLAVGTAVIAALSVSVKKTADQYIRVSADTVREMAGGKFVLQQPPGGLSSADRETDELFGALSALSDGLKKFTDGISRTAGSPDARMDEKTAEGAFKDAARNLNAAFNGFAGTFESIEADLRALGTGDFKNPAAAAAGNRTKINDALEALAGNIKMLLNEIQNTRQAVTDGRLSYRADAAGLSGGWAKAAGQLNDTVGAVSAAVQDLQAAAERIKRGDLSPVSNRNFRGDFYHLSQLLGQASGTVAAHNRELLAILDELAGYTPGRGMRREYGGVFMDFKKATVSVAERFDSLNASPTGPETTSRAPRTSTAKISSRPPASGPPTARAAASKGGDASRADAFVSANPTLERRTVVAPSASKVYDAKDFGKY